MDFVRAKGRDNSAQAVWWPTTQRAPRELKWNACKGLPSSDARMFFVYGSFANCKLRGRRARLASDAVHHRRAIAQRPDARIILDRECSLHDHGAALVPFNRKIAQQRVGAVPAVQTSVSAGISPSLSTTRPGWKFVRRALSRKITPRAAIFPAHSARAIR